MLQPNFVDEHARLAFLGEPGQNAERLPDVVDPTALDRAPLHHHCDRKIRLFHRLWSRPTIPQRGSANPQLA